MNGDKIHLLCKVLFFTKGKRVRIISSQVVFTKTKQKQQPDFRPLIQEHALKKHSAEASIGSFKLGSVV